MDIIKTKIGKILKWSSLPAIIMFIILLLYNLIINPGFFRRASFFNYLLTSSPLLCVIMGVCASKVVGCIDISLGSLLSLINVIMATLFSKTDLSIFAVIAIAIGVGLTGGLLNGFAVGILRVNPLLATFATSSVFSGLALWIMPNPGGFGVPAEYIKFNLKIHFGFLPSCIILLAIPLLIWTIYMKSQKRVAFYGIGCNEISAYISGMPVASTRVYAHLFGGLCATIGAIISTGLIASGDPNLGESFSLKAITAVVIGGVALSGGEGDIWGTLFGGLFLTVILITIVGSTVSTFSQNFANYLILIIGLLIAVIVKLIGARERRVRRAGETS
jgi:ribose transport system permease protein